MSELWIRDEPTQKGYAYTSNGRLIRELVGDGEWPGWRPATRKERFWYEFRRERFSYRWLLVWFVIWAVIVTVWDQIS